MWCLGNIKNLFTLIKKLKKEEYKIIALEQAKNAIDYKKFKTPKKIVFIVGNEVDGLSEKILKECDSIIEIPMKGKKESLNVAVSFGIAIFRILEV